MQEFQNLPTPELIDLLAKYTSDYTKMLNEGGPSEDFEKCKVAIKALQTEIETRKNSESTNNTAPFNYSSE